MKLPIRKIQSTREGAGERHSSRKERGREGETVNERDRETERDRTEERIQGTKEEEEYRANKREGRPREGREREERNPRAQEQGRTSDHRQGDDDQELLSAAAKDTMLRRKPHVPNENGEEQEVTKS